MEELKKLAGFVADFKLETAGPDVCEAAKGCVLDTVCLLYTSNGELVDTKKHNIAYIFQEYSTMSWLTVEENVAFGLKMKRKPKEVIDREVSEVLEMVGLTKYKDYYPVELSTSMLQRVVIARAFAVKPDILLMLSLIHI